MKRLLLSLVCALFLFTVPARGHVVRALESIARLDIMRGGEAIGFCTAFSINQREGLWLTAAHCEEEALFIGGEGTRVVKADPVLDLMVLAGARAPHLKWETRPPKAWDEIVTRGHVGGSPLTWAFPGRIIFLVVDNEEGAYWPSNLAYAGTAGPGMSGGPILSKRGRVIGVHQGRWHITEVTIVQLGSPYETTRLFTEGYWAR